MNDASKNEAQAWIGSVLLHVLFFLLLAFGGFFAIHRDDIQKPIDVVLYDADAGTGPGGPPRGMRRQAGTRSGNGYGSGPIPGRP